ncbi:uncharacterized, partial [Tachysurus ichikawai]
AWLQHFLEVGMSYLEFGTVLVLFIVSTEHLPPVLVSLVIARAVVTPSPPTTPLAPNLYSSLHQQSTRFKE